MTSIEGVHVAGCCNGKTSGEVMIPEEIVITKIAPSVKTNRGPLPVRLIAPMDIVSLSIKRTAVTSKSPATDNGATFFVGQDVLQQFAGLSKDN